MESYNNNDDMQYNEFSNFYNSSLFSDNFDLNLLSLSNPTSSESRSGQNDGATPINLYNDIDNIQTRELSNNNNELNEGHINTNNENINIFNNSHPEILEKRPYSKRPRK